MSIIVRPLHRLPGHTQKHIALISLSISQRVDVIPEDDDDLSHPNVFSIGNVQSPTLGMIKKVCSNIEGRGVCA